MINLGKLREDQLEPAERERLIVDGQDPYRHPAYPSGNLSVARKQEEDGRSVNNFAAAPKRLDSRSRTLRRPVCVPQLKSVKRSVGQVCVRQSESQLCPYI